MKRAAAVETGRIIHRRDPAAADLVKQIEQQPRSVPPAHRHYPFFRANGWYFDFAWPMQLVAADVLSFNLLTPFEKYNFAQNCGWRVFRFSPQEVRDGRAIEIIARAVAHPPLFK